MSRPSFRQFLLVAVVALLLAVLGGMWLLGTHWGQRQLEQLIRARVEQHSALVLAPFRVELSIWRNFPHLTASVQHLSLTDTSFHHAVPVLRVGRADLRLELRQLWRGEFRVSHLTLRDAEFRQFTDSLGHDWGLRGRGPRRTQPAAPPNFDLDSLLLLNVRVLDRNELQGSGFAAYVREGRLTARVRGGTARIGGLLRGQLEYLRSGRGNLFVQEPIVARVRYRYNFRRREGTFRRTQATLNGDTVLISGTHRGAGPTEPRGTHLNLRFRGTQPLLEVLRVALPTGLHRYLSGARSASHARIWYTIQGVSGPTTRPRTVLRFALRDAQLQWADSARRIRRWDAQGVFDNGPDHSSRTTSLSFQHCRLHSKAGDLDAALTVRDFTRPRLLGHVRGRTELQTLAAVVAPGLWRPRQGQAALDLALNGALPALPSRNARRHRRRLSDTQLPPISARGTVQLENASFVVPKRGATMEDLTVRVRLRDSLWVLENLVGRLNGMRVQANATTTYLLAYFSGQHPTTHVAGTFAVDELRVLELRRLLLPPGGRPRPRRKLPAGRTPNQVLASRALNLLPPGLQLNITLRCGRLVLATDTLDQLAATVRHNGRRVQLLDLQGRLWGGQLSGTVSWPTDTLTLQPVTARLAVHFLNLRYQTLLTRLMHPAHRPARHAPAGPTLRDVLLAANGQAQVTAEQVLLPNGADPLTNLDLHINKSGPRFEVPTLTFGTGGTGIGRVSASAHLAGNHLTEACTDLDLRYATLDVQHLLRLLAALSPAREAGAAPRSRARTEASPLLDGTVTGNVRVTAGQVYYGILRGQDFRLLSSLEAGQVRLQECALRALGGSINLRGTLQTEDGPAHHPLHAQVRLLDIELPALFDLASTLGFDVLGPDNIRGNMHAEADVYTDLDAAFLPHLLQTQAFLRTSLSGLELLQVEALRQALRPLRARRTNHLYFEPVESRFALDGGRLLIPSLNLSSNLTDLQVVGEYSLDGHANLYVGLSPLQALFGNNNKRVARISSGEATQRPSRGLIYLNLRRTPGSRYRVRPFQKQEQRQFQTELQREYHQLLLRQPLDTTLQLLQ